jgi:hypothetical protein
MSAQEAWHERAETALGMEAWDEAAHADLRALAAQAEALWPGLDTAGRQGLLRCLRALGDRLRADMRRIEGEMAQSARRRAGVRGYGQLQSCHRAQRLRRRA